MSKRRPDKKVRENPRRPERWTTGLVGSWCRLLPIERLAVVAMLGLLFWALLQTVWHYPATFSPRFADEAVYALDVGIPGSLFDDYTPGEHRYAATKLGYGLPLAASSVMFGPVGASYFSTLCWLSVLAIVPLVTYRRFGLLAAMVGVSLTAVSAILGKYLAEVAPTLEVTVAFLLLWAACARRRFWLSGVAIGFIAFIDFKWALPAGLAFLVIELLVDLRRSIKERALHVILTGIVALGLIVLAVLLHPPYGRLLSVYVSSHAKLIDFQPSPVFIYYLIVFGSLPAFAVAVAAPLFPSWRARFRRIPARSRQSFWEALILAVVPILYHSLFGIHKGLRFFAVSFPLLIIPASVAIATLFGSVSERFSGGGKRVGLPALILIPLILAAVVHGGSRGPAYHLTLQSGYQEAIKKLKTMGLSAHRGSISSYNWPVVWYGWPARGSLRPFAYEGLSETDHWIALDPVPDRATVEYRILVDGQGTDPDSVWMMQRAVLTAVSDSLFSVPSDFYSSDYYLSELVVNGAAVFRNWRKMARTSGGTLTLRQISGTTY